MRLFDWLRLLSDKHLFENHSQLFENKTINATVYPIFRVRRVSSVDDLEFLFHISAKYNFEAEIWKSGGLEIKKHYWAETNQWEPKYPILNDR